jgi:CDP-diacylglycerol--glycerol-3-phosphate 3-phosphatidyltransferase
MDIGLYNLKYPVRKMLNGLLPALRNVDPNHISLAMLPVGLVTAFVYYEAAQGRPALYLVGIALIFLRMFLGTLDGLVATHYGKSGPTGEMVNRIAPELCDAMLLVALAVARPEWRLVGIGALAVAWLTTFSGLLGLTAGLTTQSVGPVGQTDRLAALQLFSLLAFFSERSGWRGEWLGDFMRDFLLWVIGGGILTVALRLWRNLRAARAPAAR